jgi:ATP-dependent RNA helicase RhlE
MTNFSGLELTPLLLRAVSEEGYTTPTPIQAQSIPPLLQGRDLLGVAQTGTGKTAAFALPLLHHLSGEASNAHDQGPAHGPGKPKPGRPRALILAPTRELAGQINDSFKAYGRYLGVRSGVVFGGTSIRPQIQMLNRGIHILAATPGRLLDLMQQGYLKLDAVEVFILDEADRMLDMGFIHDVKKIAAAVPSKRQTLLFSATMPKSVQGLADGLLNDPVQVEVAPAATTAEKVDQHVMFVPKDKKRALLSNLLNDKSIKRVLIFTRTKHGADRVTKHLHQNGVDAAAIHGNKAQNARQRALNDFRAGRVRALVATDIAARGIDVDGVSHVINFDLPNEPESYVHRIGRTARAGATGIAMSFCDHEERGYLRDIEKIIRQTVPVITDQPFHSDEIANSPGLKKVKQKSGRNGQGRNGQSRNNQGRNGQGRNNEGRNGSGRNRPSGNNPDNSHGENRSANGDPTKSPSRRKKYRSRKKSSNHQGGQNTQRAA